jgi:hypothetical protein
MAGPSQVAKAAAAEFALGADEKRQDIIARTIDLIKPGEEHHRSWCGAILDAQDHINHIAVVAHRKTDKAKQDNARLVAALRRVKLAWTGHSDPTVRRAFPEGIIRQWIEVYEELEHEPTRLNSRDGSKQRAAAEWALGLLLSLDRIPTMTRGGSFLQLTALLCGNPGKDHTDICGRVHRRFKATGHFRTPIQRPI